MKKIILFIFYLTTLISCSEKSDLSNEINLLDGTTCNPGENPNTFNCSIIKNKLTREFIIYIPESYYSQTSRVPLLFSLHGYTSFARVNIEYTGFKEIADNNGFIVIYPQGSLWFAPPSDINGYTSQGQTHWNVGWGNAGTKSTSDDITFIEDLIDWTSSNYNINTDRVYSTGMSNGGFMSYNLACNLSSKIAAIASVTGSMSPQNYRTCNPDRPMPILQIHGLQDYVVPYLGLDSRCEPIENVINYWVDFNSCNKNSIDNTIIDINNDDYGGVHKTYKNGKNNVAVELYLLDRMGHSWPRINAPGWDMSFDIDAPSIIWSFLSKYDINGLIN